MKKKKSLNNIEHARADIVGDYRLIIISISTDKKKKKKKKEYNIDCKYYTKHTY